MKYVMRRLEKLSDARVLEIARQVAGDFPDDALQAAIERLTAGDRLITELTRHHLAEALNPFALGGGRGLVELLRKHWPSIDDGDAFGSLAMDIEQHAVTFSDWNNAQVLEQVGFFSCSQARLFGFLEDVLHPIRRGQEEQQRMLAALNPILRRDGYCWRSEGAFRGIPFTGCGGRRRLAFSRPTS
jgi:hypothetical protein